MEPHRRREPRSAVLTAITPVARDTNVYTFDLDAPLPFRAGQFVNLGIPGATPRPERSYSIYSDPVDPSRLELCIKLLEGGQASEYLRRVAVGQGFTLRGPYGLFTLQPGDDPAWMVCTATGIAPFRSILLERARLGDARPFHLLFGVRAQPDLFLVDELAALGARLPGLRTTVCLSRPEPGWTGFTGRVTHRLAAAPPDPAAHYYLCGNGPMLEEARAYLKGAGLDRTRIHFEKFY